MAHIVADRVLESTTTVGTGDITLAAALAGFRRFSAVCATGDTVPYFIEAIDAQGMPIGDYEYGIGTYSAANTLTRTKVEGSSNAGALVNFSTGSKNVGIPALAMSLVPVGAIFDFAGNAAPAGYFEMNGSLKSRLQYPALYAYAVGSGNMAASDGAWTKGQFSPGDGSTTFRIPDHRGYHRRTWDNGAGVDPARAIGSIQADQMVQHNHSAVVNDTGHAHAQHGSTLYFVGAPTTNVGAPTFSANTQAVNTASSTTGITVNIANTGAGTETRVKTIAVLTAIKY